MSDGHISIRDAVIAFGLIIAATTFTSTYIAAYNRSLGQQEGQVAALVAQVRALQVRMDAGCKP